MSAEQFTLTAEHIALLRRANVSWSGDDEWGAPCIDEKRPYGNSQHVRDIAEITGIDYDHTSERATWEPVRERLLKLHRETSVALDIVLNTGSFEPGVYERVDWRNWRRVGG